MTPVKMPGQGRKSSSAGLAMVKPPSGAASRTACHELPSSMKTMTKMIEPTSSSRTPWIVSVIMTAFRPPKIT